MALTYDEAVMARDFIDKQVTILSNRLNTFPRGPNGLTPDEVKFSPAYRKVKAEFDAAFKMLRAANSNLRKMRKAKPA